MEEQNILISDLFSDNLRKRYEYSVECRTKSPDKLKDVIEKRFPVCDWPNCWFGSANAWLVFLGPSRGNSRGGKIDEKNKRPTIGFPNDHFATYSDEAKFYDHIRDYTKVMFNNCNFFKEDSDCYSMALVTNVIDSNIGDSRNIKRHELETGMRDVVYNKLELIKPKVIIALNIPVQKALIKILYERGAQNKIEPETNKVKSGIKSPKFYHPELYQLKTSWGDLIVSKTPMHPSRYYFCDQDNVKKYLGNVMKLSLENQSSSLMPFIF